MIPGRDPKTSKNTASRASRWACWSTATAWGAVQAGRRERVEVRHRERVQAVHPHRVGEQHLVGQVARGRRDALRHRHQRDDQTASSVSVSAMSSTLSLAIPQR